ncbi:MAG: peptidoglycan-binding protein [Proteobacteria bacterium]|nr:peptidoglycan-binding protein [Pseudomonadota bacterium]
MEQATVSASSVNVRSGPSTKKKLLGRLNKGETFSYSSDQNGWLQTIYKNQTAYVCKQYTKTGGNAQTPQQEPPKAEPLKEEDSYNESSAIAFNKAAGFSSAQWKVIQKAVGTTADGKPGKNTARKIRDWQKSHGLPANGKCDDATYAAITGGAQNTETPQNQKTETPEPPKSTTPEPPKNDSGEKLLNSTQVESAIEYNRKNNVTIWKEIQAAVGTAQTGLFDETSVQAIASWQKNNGLEADGKFGKKSLDKAGIKKKSSGSLKYGEVGPGGLTYASNRFLQQNHKSGFHPKDLVDLQTGKRFTISWHTPSLGYHSDCSPNDKAAVDTMKSIVNPGKAPDDYDYWSHGSSWSWKGRPGAVKVKDGLWVACGFHLRPHGSLRGGQSPDKPCDKASPNNRPEASKNITNNKKAREDAWKPGGHFCVYYNKDNGGGTKECNQAAEDAKFMQCPETE